MSISTPPRALVALTGAALALAGLPAGAAALENPCPRPTQASISIDGDISDWNQVLTNPANTTRDGDGSTVTCGLSDDRDCGNIGGDGSEQDVMRFAWTWDDTALYLLWERVEWRLNTLRLHLHVDADRSGAMEDGEPVILVHSTGTADTLWAAVGPYAAADPAGDPLEDAAGFADGHQMPGAILDAANAQRTGSVAVSPDIRRFEVAVPWDSLGLAPGTAFRWHGASSGGGALPNNFSDSIGGPDDTAGDTGFHAVALDAPWTTGAPSNTTVRLVHEVGNDGNLPLTPRLTVTSSSSHRLELRADPDGDAVFDLLLATDVDGDGLFLTPGDALEPAGDSDGDGRLDLGLLGRGESVRYEISVFVPPGADGLIERVSSRVEAAEAVGCVAVVEDRIHVGDVALIPNRRSVIVAGDSAWLAHELVNNTTSSVTADLSVLSGRGWPWTLHLDSGGAGRPADAIALTDSNGNGLVDATLPPGSSLPLLARADAPAGEAPGELETAVVRAFDGGVPVTFAQDDLTVVEPLSLEPDHLLAAGDARYGGAGESLYFPHRVRNNLGRSATLTLFATSDLGWPAEVLLDPDGDGRPSDAQAIPTSTVALAHNGGEAALFVRVTIPPGVADDTLATITLTAENDRATPDLRTVTDEAIVSIVRTYQDDSHSVQANAFAPCGVVHAVASGLTPSDPAHRFLWRDASGLVRASASVTTDAVGFAHAELLLDPNDDGPGFSVAIESFDGLTWQEIDRFEFRVEGAARVLLAGLRTPPPGLQPARVAADAVVRNESYDAAIAGLAYRWALLSPGDASYWDTGAAAFLPWDGSQATTTGTLDLQPREQRAAAFDVPDVVHETDGLHRLAFFLGHGCSGEDLEEASLEYRVVDDDDGDGLSRSEEIAAGTDPDDADSDDDGLLDGEDGVNDSDGDGVIDALDCDSDDDGLPDGLEAGVWFPSPDTDVAAGCYRPDEEPSTTTDPDDPDTDGGGVPDGLEDRNGNGRLDGGELDPLDPADDPPCDAAAPEEVTGLRLARAADGDLLLSWTPQALDACSQYEVAAGSTPTQVFGLGVAVTDAAWSEPDLGEPLRFYLVRANSSYAGPGSWGR